GRTQYTGATMAAAKAIVDAAQGGMVLISPETFQRIPAKLLQNRLLIASMGEHVLGKGHEQTRMQLYQVLALQLVHRAAQLGPVRSVSQLSHGFLEAPCNNAAICFMNVSYLTALEMWNPVVTAAALKMWNHTVQDILTKRGGYLVEAADGLCLAAFPRPSCAIRWALESIEACLHLDWPSKLLENELGEEQFFSPLGKSHSSRFFGRRTMSLPRDPAVLHKDQQPLMDRPSVQPSMASAASMIPLTELERVLVFRGLRMKVGIDWGAVKADLHAATARVTFRGRVMNRAARISNVAKCGQVWCSEGAWEAAAPEINNLDRYPHTTKCGAKFGAAMAGHAMGDEDDSDSQEHTCVRATALGPYQLKGIVHNMELYHCY
ncbi:nucleotide cyclase, partial [Dunaliella salina]